MKIKNKIEFSKDLKILNVKEICLKYGLCKTSVYCWKKKFGLNTHFSDIVPKDFVEYSKTHNKLQATVRYKTSYATIRKWEHLADCKCSKLRGKRNYERNCKIKELCENNTYSKVGEMFGLTRQRIEQIVNEEQY